MVEAQIRHISLLAEPVPVYETISYCWGAPRPLVPMKINGKVSLVQASANEAIRRMRLEDRTRVLWVDAVCIDQESTEDKNQQVAFMGTIYRHGTCNLVWLGEDTSGLALRAIRDIGQMAEDMRLKTRFFTEDPCPEYGSFLEKTFEFEIDGDALAVLFRIQWLRRLWVVQEAVLARENICHWGRHQFPLLTLLRAAGWCILNVNFVPLQFAEEAVYRGICCAAQMLMFAAEHSIYGNDLRRTVWGVLDMANSFQKTEQRDSIYGTLSLLDEKTRTNIEFSELLKVDYRKPYPDIWRDATRVALCEDGSLNGLSPRQSTSADLTGSSDFDVSWGSPCDESRHGIGSRKDFQTSDGMANPELLNYTSHGLDLLLCEGFTLAKVQTTTPSFSGDDRHEFTDTTIPTEFLEWLRLVKSAASRAVSAGSKSLGMSIAQTLTMASYRETTSSSVLALSKYLEDLEHPFPAPDSHNSEHSAQLTSSATFRNILKSGLDACRSFITYEQPSESQASESSTRLSPSAALREELGIVLKDCKFFVTDDGHMGLGPPAMEVEDIVVILRTGRMPFILRKSGADQHKLVGSAYVDGIMYGEAVKAAKQAWAKEMEDDPTKEEGGWERVFKLV